MKMSRRAKRMERHHQRKKRVVGISLVSMMDIFTILVFFLLFNQAEVQILKHNKTILLPDSVAETQAKKTLVISVNADDIMIEGRKIESVSNVLNSDAEEIPLLKTELDNLVSEALQQAGTNAQPFRGEVTILGDKKLPFALLKKIMATCSNARFEDIQLGVTQKPRESS